MLFAGILFLFGSGNNPLFPVGLTDDPVGTGCVSFLVINGKSNINNFSFTYVTPLLSKEDIVSKGAEDEKIDLVIPVELFKPSNHGMYNDFLTLLNAKDYPYIKISLLSGDLYLARDSEVSQSEKISVTIAGVTREYIVNCILAHCNENLIINGMQTVKLSDFSLKAPVRLVGLVKVHNEIDVKFGFIINFTEEHTAHILQ